MLRPLLLSSICLLTLACGPSREIRAATVANNPAGQNCIQNGGKLVVRLSSAGEKGYCMLPDGRSLDIWEYFRQTNP